ncbi:DUF185-domain-containing protein [Dacryopinax primogenitus]|uniref:Protein arginine methyltransferase NDUFAF7 n=1 Tax=Dacryopinax primogenitus (strain DJM 731) TaxID=1858805 RepID=M5G612_DACPD|nr:DUF185-domain-containing protein [Dacryopinax primogenitus]EJU03655.1 DUF185-domain-containing protein [Dacryopinax primogenitus]
MSLQLSRAGHSRAGPLILARRGGLACSRGRKQREYTSQQKQYAPKHETNPAKYNWNPNNFTDELPKNYEKYPLLTASQLSREKKPRREVKMLVRDFIADALYNPNYGYFPKQAVILSSPEPFDFPSLKNSDEFNSMVARTYATDDTGPRTLIGRQLWHTPTELFKPWYGSAIAQCLTADYMLKYFPYEDFIIYEVGGGNGTLARNILDFVRDYYPDIYERTSYRIIEISPQLAEIQKQQLKQEHENVEVIIKDILQWDKPDLSPCYFIAAEVIDNFPHDIIRYRTEDLKPAQCVVVVDSEGSYTELYEPITDPLITRFLAYRTALHHQPPVLTRVMTSPVLRFLRQALPMVPNLSSPEFIPTHLLLFLEKLRRNFPQHRLLLSDFFSLPEALSGYNAPVVQTRYRGAMIPCTTYLVQPGYFDIFFPTNFERLGELYELVMSLPHTPQELDIRSSPILQSDRRLASDFFSARGRSDVEPTPVLSGKPARLGPPLCNIFTHKEFLTRYANIEATTLRNGENPLLEFYQNAKFLF